ncbi:MAG: ABC transporter permease subunit [Firmicutes bacterium]|nr:ABC transporter permease subunit [Bacillota bacterium]
MVERRLRPFAPPRVHPALGVDAALLVGVLLLLYALVRAAPAVAGPIAHAPAISLSPASLPGYVGLSLLRMTAAFAASLLFSLVYGYVAAHSAAAERILIPLLDILQSVPVLGFLSFTVTAFVQLAPGSLIGPQLASVFAIFTAQAWNMTFAFYHSLRTIPRDLGEAAALYHLGPLERLLQLELPAAVIPLVWNSMLSFGASWVFLTASEAITVSSHTILLPGIGSYIAVAIARGAAGPVMWAIATMLAVVVLLDQLVWRPLVAWSHRYQLTANAPTGEEPTSWALTLLTRSALLPWLGRHLAAPLERLRQRGAGGLEEVGPLRPWVGRVAGALLLLAAAAAILPALWHLAQAMAAMPAAVYARFLLATAATLARVLAAVLLGALWCVPVGVAIGQSRRLTAYLEPVVQNAAAFPANLLYGLAVLLFLRLHLSMSFGAVLLMMLGTQWYILFNIIAGTQALTGDLLEAGKVFGLRGMERWRSLILPGIFPSLVTGGLTAAGGAWNLSILAEAASWAGHRLVAFGLGSLITQAAGSGQEAHLFLGILLMSATVVGLNAVLWRPLYRLAESRFHIE